MSRIVTFYSYKGGVGRTFALANIAVLLARRGKHVLLMDWDLEAPGLHRYFELHKGAGGAAPNGLIHLLTNARRSSKTDWRPYLSMAAVKGGRPIHLITSGDGAADYVDRVRSFSWSLFFEEERGGVVLERWRSEWRREYDFVLIDSRTGITDTGGVCTVLLPDILVLVFSANEQSFERGVQIANGVQDARRELAVPRPPVAILPLPGRFDGRDEVDEANRWLDRFSQELKQYYDDWLPKQFSARQMLEVTKVPYVTRFSFGEPLAVVSHSITDPELPGFYLDNVARLLASDFAEAGHILSGGSSEQEQLMTDLRAQITRVPLDSVAIRQLVGQIESSGRHEQMADLLSEVGLAFMRQAHLKPAEEYLRLALQMNEERFGPRNPRTATSLFQLAEVVRMTAGRSEAEILYRRALEASEASLGFSDPMYAIACAKLAGLYREEGRHKEAEAMYERVIHRQEQLERPGDPSLTTAYNNLASLYRETGRLHEAESMYERVLLMLQRTAKPGDPAITAAFNNLGTLYRETMRLDEARAMYERVLHLLEQYSSESDPALANAYSNLAALHREAGRLEEAAAMYSRALDAISAAPGKPNDPALVDIYHSLASVLHQSGRFDAAETTYRRALRMLEVTARPGDPAFAVVYSSLAGFYEDMGSVEHARHMYEQALQTLEVAAMPDEFLLASTYHKLASLHRNVGRLDEARAVYERALKLLEGRSVGGAPTQGRLLNGLGEVLLEMGRTDEAERVWLQSLSAGESIVGRELPESVKTRENLARILEMKGRRDDARDLRRGLEFDACVSYDYPDRRVVHMLVRELEDRRLRVWPIESELRAAKALDNAWSRVLGVAHCVLVCIGPREVRHGQRMELKRFRRWNRKTGRPVIAVLLPGASRREAAVMGSEGIFWMDYSGGISKEGLDRLLRLISSVKSGQ